MTILREAIALIIARVDDASFREVNSRMFRLRTAIGGAIAGMVTGQFLKFGEEAARLADAEKIMNATGLSIETLRKQTRGLYSDMSLVVNYNKAQQFGIGKYFTELANIADVAGKKFGVAQNKALEDLMIGISQGRNARLDNLGILVDWHKEFDAAAAAMNIKRKDLPKANQAEIAMLAVRRIAASMKAEVAQSGAGDSDIYDQLNTGLENLKTGMGQLFNIFATDLFPLTLRFFDLLDKMSRSEGMQNVFRDLGTIVSWMARAFLVLLRIGLQVTDWFGEIPGVTYLITGALLTFMLPAIVAITQALLASVAASKLWIAIGLRFGQMTRMFGVGRVALMAFAGTALTAAAALLAVSFALDEIDAMSDPTKLGMMEEWSGRWDQMRKRISAKKGWSLSDPIIVFFSYLVELLEYALNLMIRIFTFDWKSGSFFSLDNAEVIAPGIARWMKETKEGRQIEHGSDEEFQKAVDNARNRIRLRNERLIDSMNPSIALPAYNPPTSQSPTVTIAPNLTMSVDASGQQMTPAELKQSVMSAAEEAHQKMLKDTIDNVMKQGEYRLK